MKNYKELFLDIAANIGDLLVDLFNYIKDLLIRLLSFIWEKYLALNIFGKIIYINTIGSLFAVVLPVARFYIFESYSYINNPLFVYMLGICIIMMISLYFIRITSNTKLFIRLFINIIYLAWIIYLPASGTLTKVMPHEICTGYYVNLIAPAVYIIASLLSYFYYRE